MNDSAEFDSKPTAKNSMRKAKRARVRTADIEGAARGRVAAHAAAAALAYKGRAQRLLTAAPKMSTTVRPWGFLSPTHVRRWAPRNPSGFPTSGRALPEQRQIPG